MTRPDPRFELLDPVDPDAPAPDVDRLLESILAVDVVPATRPRSRPPRLQIGLGAASAVAVAALAVGIPRGTGVDDVAAAYEAVHQPDTVLHYTRRTTLPAGAPDVPRQYFDEEVWQAGDGSRQRVVSRAPGVGLHEEVVDGDRSLTYVESSNELIVYDEKAPKPAAPGAVHAGGVGDPRTLLERARSGDASIKELGDAEVRGVDVVQFRVGTCKVRSNATSGGASTDIRPAFVMSIAKDDSLPVRVAATCPPEDWPDGTRPAALPPMDGFTDYLEFEVLPASEANERHLEMTPHPGARTVDGEDVDAAEERADDNFDSSPPPPPEAAPEAAEGAREAQP